MLLTHVSGTIGGVTAAGGGALLAASRSLSAAPEIVVAASALVGAITAVVSFWRGWKRDPTAALAEHTRQDNDNFGELRGELTHVNEKVDQLVAHFLGADQP